MALIEVKNICKNFEIYKRQKGFANSLKSLFSRQYEIKRAVDNISFNLERGELVGYVGPNGAGKSTTIKMLAGILVPTSGTITVDGKIPHLNRKQNAMHIGVVFGQRSQLYWDLPMEDTFELYKKMYKIDNQRFRRNVDFYIELLEMQEFLRRPVRQLSLGQKMRADLAVALLHDPEIVYLDEPTIGLDVVAKSRIRRFIKEVNKEKKTTVILTTHDMDDIEQICTRLIMIDKGQMIYDGTLEAFKEIYGEGHMLTVDFADESVKIDDSRLKVIKEEGPRKWIVFKKQDIGIAEAVTLITRKYNITDLNLKEPDIEEIVKTTYEKKNSEVQVG